MTKDIKRNKLIERNNRKHSYNNFTYYNEKYDICQYCEKLVRIDTREQHNDTKRHQLMMNKYFNKEYYECKDCDYKSISLQYFVKHILKYAHAPLKPYKCTNTPLKYESNITAICAENEYKKEPLKKAVLTVEF